MRKRRLDSGVSLHQRVIGGVADDRRVLPIIMPRMFGDFLRQPCQFGGGFVLGHVDRAHAAIDSTACGRAGGGG